LKMKVSPGIVAANAAVIALAVITWLSMSMVQPHYPLNGMVTDDRTPSFQWSGQRQEYELLIDDDPGFGSPLSYNVFGNEHAVDEEMEFGTYWWKVRSGGAESSTSKFTVVSTVALSRMGPNAIMNSGNVPLLVHLGGLTGAATLAVNQTTDIGDAEDVKAEQK
jgi:hypothetical protein